MYIFQNKKELLLEEEDLHKGQRPFGVWKTRGLKFERVLVPKSKAKTWKKTYLYKFVSPCINSGAHTFAEIIYY